MIAYANNVANVAEVSNVIIGAGSVYIKDFSGNWIVKTKPRTNSRISKSKSMTKKVISNMQKKKLIRC